MMYNRFMKRFMIALAILTAALLSGCGGETDTPVVDIALPATEAPVSAPTPESSAPPEPSPTPEQPRILTDALVAVSAHYRDLDCEQIIVVDADGSDAVLYRFERDAAGAWSMAGEGITAHVGRSGVSYNKKENDGATPGGIFHIGFAFGSADKPNTAMEYWPVTDGSYWVTDPDSAGYNTWVEGTAEKDWDSAIRLSRSEEYSCAAVIEYNYADACVPGKGSAIFICCGDKATGGSVAVSAADMLALLEWLDPMRFPNIIITP